MYVYVCVYNTHTHTHTHIYIFIYVYTHTHILMVAQMVKKSACHVGDPGLIPGSGRSLGEGRDNPLQYPCLENFMDRGA